MISASQFSGENLDTLSPTARPTLQSIATQTDASGLPTATPPEPAPEPPRAETVTYSKAVQTDDWTPPSTAVAGETALDLEDGPSSPTSKRLSRRERERDDEIRERLRKEIVEELQATRQLTEDGPITQSTRVRYPLRTLNEDELNAVTSSDDFLEFVERSSKVIERALDEEYDVLADYELGGINAEDEEEDAYGKKRRGIKEVAQYYDERWSKKRMISDLSFSPKVSVLTLI